MFERILKRSKHQDSTIESRGCIDHVEHHVISGWFIDRGPGIRDNHFILALDNTELGTFCASSSRPDVHAVEGVLCCGFSFSIAEQLTQLPQGIRALDDGTTHRFSMHTLRGELVAEREFHGKAPTAGFLERCDRRGLAGWAANLLTPDGPTILEVWVDGQYFCDLKSSEHRHDVFQKEGLGGLQGFRQDWPANLFPTGATVDVRHKANGESLNRSPMTLPPAPSALPRRTVTYLRAENLCPVVVLVPIYNAFEAVRDCLIALDEHTPRWVTVALLDDSSTDPRIQPLLTEYGKRGYNLHRNERNVGYTGNINSAMRRYPDADIVLLNSDTEVTVRWLQALRYCAYATPKVATVTALSDNAGAFSAPNIGVANPLPPHMNKAEYALAITHAGEGRFLEVPTGNGFCMYVRRRAVEDIGEFDQTLFPRGYGEENDFCMRAQRAGWINLVCDKAYVFHKRSQSFQTEKEALIRVGTENVRQRYPEYRMLTARFQDAEFHHVRHRARLAVASYQAAPPLPRILYVTSTQTGGTPQTNLDLMRAMRGRYECWHLRCDGRSIVLSQLVDTKLESRETHPLSRSIEPLTHRSHEYDDIVVDILYRYSIELVHVRHVVWHSLGLSLAIRSLDVRLVFSIHDYYSVCAAHNLLDDRLRFCGGVCTEGLTNSCQIELWPSSSLPSMKHGYVYHWRELFQAFIDDCDHLITTSPSAAQVFLSAYPTSKAKLSVIPHGRDFNTMSSPRHLPASGEKLKVLVPGNLGVSKGARLIQRVADIDADSRIEFHFLGRTVHYLSSIGVHHGIYDRDSFSSLVDTIQPHVGLALSIWAETHCHTLTEMWAAGVPVIALDRGAVGERIAASEAGWLLDPSISAEDIYEAILRFTSDHQGLAARLAAVESWQSSLGRVQNNAWMAQQYRLRYRQTTDAQSRPMRVALLTREGDTWPPPTAYIRLILPMERLARKGYCEPRVVAFAEIAGGALQDFDALIVQRDAVPHDMLDVLLAELKRHSVPMVYEIDDLLWALPQDHHQHAANYDLAEDIPKLLRAADIVTTSTEPLAVRIRRYNQSASVIPNQPDRALWLTPPDDVASREAVDAAGLSTNRPRILYMGNRSHAADLEMIAPALSLLKLRRPYIEIVQIGGGYELPGARVIHPPSGYPRFVPWFRAVASSCLIGLAPLRSTSFNSVKSSIKVIDYALAGLPSICSAVEPYCNTVRHMENGLLCENQTDAWVDAIDRLVSDPALCARIADHARNSVWGGTQRSADTCWEEVLGRLHGASHRQLRATDLTRNNAAAQ